MGQISSGVGIISGINFTELIDQLLAIEARPKTIIKNQNLALTSEQVAFQEVDARLLATKLSANSLLSATLFDATTATSSDESVLTATSTSTATPGSYRFTVDRLVQIQQVLTRGFADRDATPLAAGRLTFEFGQGSLHTNTDLGVLNGQSGMRRGTIRITDRSGGTADVDLTKALLVDDVVDAINLSNSVQVSASVDGDYFVITDTSGGSGRLTVTDLAGGSTAADLGLAGSAPGSTLTGTQVNRVARATVRSSLNDGNGVRIDDALDDFEIVLRDGVTVVNVNLHTIANPTLGHDAAGTVGDVIDQINSAADTVAGGGPGSGLVRVSINSAGTGIKLVDLSTDNGTPLAIKALNSQAAADLGIDQTLAGGADTIEGKRLLAALNSRLARTLRGSGGIDFTGTLKITDRAGTLHTITNLDTADSVSDLIGAIDTQTAGKVVASLNRSGNGLRLTDVSGGFGSMRITGTIAESDALNLAGIYADGLADSGNLQRQYLTEATLLSALNGGKGINGTRFDIRDSVGDTITVDIGQGEMTIAQLLDDINFRSPATIQARINDTGDGILIEDVNTGTKNFALEVLEKGSTTARDLGILGQAASIGGHIDGTREKSITIAAVSYLTTTTQLDDLNGGSGVGSVIGLDDMTFTQRDGTTFTVNLDSATTIQNVIAAISTASAGDVTAAINAAGTGLNVTDSTTGGNTFTIAAADSSGGAEDLGIAGKDDDGDGTLFGTRIISIPTVDSVVQQINDAGLNVRATVIDDGSPVNPFRILLASIEGGSAGSFVFDAAATVALGTTLGDLNNSVGVRVVSGLDDLDITTRDGNNFQVNLDGETTVADVIDAIETASPGTVSVAINAAGSGLNFTDATSGATTFTISAVNGSMAADDLGILSADGDGDGVIHAGQIIQRDMELGDSTLTDPQDAVVFYGSSDPARSVPIRSPSNTLASVLPGMTIDLAGTSSGSVLVTVNRDDSPLADAVESFVSGFNDAIAVIDKHDSYDADTETRGVLLGDATVGAIRGAMFRLLSMRNSDVTGSLTTLAALGLTVGSGAKLNFNKAKFATALDENRDDVKQLFTLKTTTTDPNTGQTTLATGGTMARFEDLLERFTSSTTGTLQRRVTALGDQIELGNDRIASLNERLDARRKVLEAQFIALERTLATLQSQSAALTSLQPLVQRPTSRTSRSGSLFGSTSS